MVNTFYQPKPSTFLFQSPGAEKIYQDNIEGRDHWNLCNRMEKAHLAENGMIGNFWLISLKINLDDFIFRW